MRRLLVSFFGLGYGPVAPGTWGSFGAVVIYAVLWRVLGMPWCWWSALILAVAACVVNLLLGDWAIEHYGSSDPKQVVIDEAAGMWLSVLLVPAHTAMGVLWVCGLAFVVFRAFDILKLPPARQLERLPGGAGILCDDLAAGVQTNIVLQVVFRLLWSA